MSFKNFLLSLRYPSLEDSDEFIYLLNRLRAIGLGCQVPLSNDILEVDQLSFGDSKNSFSQRYFHARDQYPLNFKELHKVVDKLYIVHRIMEKAMSLPNYKKLDISSIWLPHNQQIVFTSPYKISRSGYYTLEFYVEFNNVHVVTDTLKIMERQLESAYTNHGLIKFLEKVKKTELLGSEYINKARKSLSSLKRHLTLLQKEADNLGFTVIFKDDTVEVYPNKTVETEETSVLKFFGENLYKRLLEDTEDSLLVDKEFIEDNSSKPSHAPNAPNVLS